MKIEVTCWTEKKKNPFKRTSNDFDLKDVRPPPSPQPEKKQVAFEAYHVFSVGIFPCLNAHFSSSPLAADHVDVIAKQPDAPHETPLAIHLPYGRVFEDRVTGHPAMIVHTLAVHVNGVSPGVTP